MKRTNKKPDPNAVRLAFIGWWKSTENMIDNVLPHALRTPGHPLYECLTEEESEGALEGLSGCTDTLTNGCPLPPFFSTEALYAALGEEGG